MQVQAISSYNKGFTGKRDRIDQAIVQDDKTIRDYAAYQTLNKVQDKKHKKISNVLWHSIPVAAGLSAAVLSKGKSSMFGKELTGLAAKTANGIKSALPWAITLGVADAVCEGNKFITNNSKTANEIEHKHPILSIGALLTAGLALWCGTSSGLGKLYGKMSPKLMAKLGNGAGKAGEAINKIKTPKFIQKPLSKLSEKMPQIIKNGTKNVINVLPEALVFTSLFHSINHNMERNREFNKNYSGMKEAQLNLAKARVKELQIENDLFKQFPENVENLELLKHPKQDLDV